MKSAIVCLIALGSSYGIYEASERWTAKLGAPGVIGVGILFFAAFVTYSVHNANTHKYRKDAILSPIVREYIENVIGVIAALTLVVVSVVLIAAVKYSVESPDLDFNRALYLIIESLPNMLDV